MSRKLLFTVLAVTGCATPPSYQEQIAAIQIPQDEAERQRLCGDLRNEIARMQAAPMQMATPNMAPYFRMVQAQNIAVLEQKASEVGCNAAFGGSIGKPPMAECIKLCKTNTSRSDEQCFDACNK